MINLKLHSIIGNLFMNSVLISLRHKGKLQILLCTTQVATIKKNSKLLIWKLWLFVSNSATQLEQHNSSTPRTFQEKFDRDE